MDRISNAIDTFFEKGIARGTKKKDNPDYEPIYQGTKIVGYRKKGSTDVKRDGHKDHVQNNSKHHEVGARVKFKDRKGNEIHGHVTKHGVDHGDRGKVVHVKDDKGNLYGRYLHNVHASDNKATGEPKDAPKDDGMDALNKRREKTAGKKVFTADIGNGHPSYSASSKEEFMDHNDHLDKEGHTLAAKSLTKNKKKFTTDFTPDKVKAKWDQQIQWHKEAAGEGDTKVGARKPTKKTKDKIGNALNELLNKKEAADKERVKDVKTATSGISKEHLDVAYNALNKIAHLDKTYDVKYGDASKYTGEISHMYWELVETSFGKTEPGKSAVPLLRNYLNTKHTKHLTEFKRQMKAIIKQDPNRPKDGKEKAEPSNGKLQSNNRTTGGALPKQGADKEKKEAAKVKTGTGTNTGYIEDFKNNRPDAPKDMPKIMDTAEERKAKVKELLGKNKVENKTPTTDEFEDAHRVSITTPEGHTHKRLIYQGEQRGRMGSSIGHKFRGSNSNESIFISNVNMQDHKFELHSKTKTKVVLKQK